MTALRHLPRMALGCCALVALGACVLVGGCAVMAVTALIAPWGGRWGRLA